ncbi:MAG: hypothetical protein KAW88_04275 [Candidatus Cloacimonetes bacterium]|nr:hypothetical protein [Candidatus Cloacimonadota bacterium]
MTKNSTRFIQITVFLTSLTILCYEIILTRIFAITQWYNLASIIISVALLGFGASGTMILLLKPYIERHYNKFIQIALILYPFTLCTGFIIFCKIHFNPFEVGIDPNQIYILFLYFLVLGIPFFFGACVIGLALMKFPIGKTYFSNLLGSGVGALSVVLISYLFHPFSILIGITILAFISAVIFSFNFQKQTLLSSRKELETTTRDSTTNIDSTFYKENLSQKELSSRKKQPGKQTIITLTISIIIILLFYFSFDLLNLKKISQYKSLSKTLLLPNSKILDERYSPLGLVQVVEADGLRSTVGLSFLSTEQVPIQKGIFFDGEAMSAVTPFKGDKKEIEYLNQIPSSLPYHLLDETHKNKILIVGVGGGEGLLKALLHDFQHIDGLELNRDVISLMKNEYADFSGNIYSKVNIIKKEARGFIKTTEKKYNLIEISMLDTYNAAASGVYALNETYLYTLESVQDFYKQLEDEGLLAITRWVVNPPRNNLKLLNTSIKALQNLGIKDIGKHIIFIRSIQATTLVISKKPFSNEQISAAKEFCNSRLFDVCYYKGIKPEEVNRFIKLKEPIYFSAAQNLLSDQSSRFIKDYEFDIKIATDNRPYFYNSFKFKMLKYLIKYGTDKIPFTEWGYLILILILIPVLITSFILIVLPLLLMKKARQSLNLRTIFYFSLIGIGFFFIEMPLIQKLILFLSHPTYSLSVIISSLLIFSGIGSYFSDRIFKEKRRIFYSVIIIGFLTLIYLLNFHYIFQLFMNKSEIIKILVTVILILPLGFFMGIPFPQGLKRIKELNINNVPWAWSINGFFSVISIILATLFAILFGFKVVFIIAIICYLGAGVISVKMKRG